MSFPDILFGLISNTSLGILVLTLAVLYYAKTYVLSRPAKSPPMPCWPLPIVGHVFSLRPSPLVSILEWKRRLGDVTSFYIGSNMYVALSSYDVLKEAFVKKADIFSDRPYNFFMRAISADDEGNLVGLAGPNWRQHRRVSMSILRTFGMGKNHMAELINKEVNAYLNAVSDMKGQATDIRTLTNSALSNVICALLIGQRFDYEDKYFVRLLSLLSQKISLLLNASVIDLFWWLEHVPGDVFGAKTVKETSHEIYHNFCIHYINKFKNELDDTSNDNFIKAFLRESKMDHDEGRDRNLDIQNLSRIIDMLFGAGSETTSIAIQWAMVFSIHHPDIQKKIYEEIVEVVGSERVPTVGDRPNLKYLNAFICESQRLRSTGPFGVQHLCTETTQVGGYTIPKGTIVLPHLDAVLKDEKIWGDPLSFRPDRFLDEEGNLHLPEEYVPFGLGKRLCLGESMARMEVFLFLSALIQRFEILPEDDNKLPSLEPVLGLTSCPQRFKVRLVERKTL